MGKLKKEKEKLKILGCKKILAVIFFAVGLICILQIGVANRTVDMALSLSKLEEQAWNLERENRGLERKISENTGLAVIEKKAKKMGMSKISSYVFLTSAVKFAFDKDK